jgi:D-alanyl-D-alanine carboxypeptidase/D-alanyl-D-alanine-endopeptidase (penicillin-binding protein 4)
MFFLLSGCKSLQINKKITKELNSNFYKNQFTGLLVYNPVNNDTIIAYNAERYFTPASNTKIITLYTALQILSDSIPAFKYSVKGDTIFLVGTGDPTFLHPYFEDSTALKKIEKYKKVQLQINNLSDYRYGPGWSWDDFDKHFNPERSSFPMYGNVVTISKPDSLRCIPKALTDEIQIAKSKINRVYNKNSFIYPEGRSKEVKIPMVIDSLLLTRLWDSIAPNKVIINNSLPKLEHTAYSSIPLDSLLKRMMHKSDNFLAEQLLIVASSTFSTNLSSYRMRQYILENQLNDLKQVPRWVDGSGLSRYNLFTPTSIVQILNKLYNELSQKRLFTIFPAGGVSGTLKNYFKGDPEPYIYAKSGTLGNNYSLSGYLLTKKGEVLIFSFMNNHFRTANTEIKREMGSILEYLRDSY